MSLWGGFGINVKDVLFAFALQVYIFWWKCGLGCIDVKETSDCLSPFSLYFQALQLGQDSYSFEQRSQRCQMCLRSDSLHKVMERLANPGEFIFPFF